MGERGRAVAAACVHLLTASGAVWGLLALDAIAADRLRAALGFMALAVAVDSVDGMLARRLRVSDALPGIDGALLDNLVDYLNYAVVPAYLVGSARLLPEGFDLAGPSLIVLAAALQMAHTEAKTEDRRFRGFPSYWNVVAFYLLVLNLDPRVNLVIVAALSALSLAPVFFPYPSRTRLLRRTTLALGTVWGACVLFLVARYPRSYPWVAWLSLAYPGYHAALAVRLTRGTARPDPQNTKLR